MSIHERCCIVGTVELVDVSAELPGLKYSRGLSTWKVCLLPDDILFNFIQRQCVMVSVFSNKSYHIDINSCDINNLYNYNNSYNAVLI